MKIRVSRSDRETEVEVMKTVGGHRYYSLESIKQLQEELEKLKRELW